jgi:hypothetical protein
LISDSRKKADRLPDRYFWIVSEGRDVNGDSGEIEGDPDQGTLREYRLSELARYLINPGSIEIKKRLIGCEIHYRKPRLTRIKEGFSRIFPKKIRQWINSNSRPPEVLVSNCKLKIPYMNNQDLEAHLLSIYEHLRSYDVVIKRLPHLKVQKIEHLIGICEDIGGNLSYLKLQGSVEEKIKYIATHISKDVGVVLRKAYQADGLFELRGFEFSSQRTEKTYRLVTYSTDGVPKACVMDSEDNVDFWVEDDELLKYLHLLEHSIRANPHLKDAFYLCRTGQAKAVKLFFNKKFEIDYSRTHFPKVYREVFNAQNIASKQRNLVKSSLNYLLIGVSLNYVPLTDGAEERLHTQISILHDLRAIETLKNNLPQVYSEISKSAFISEAGRFYLLDSIEGHSNV